MKLATHLPFLVGKRSFFTKNKNYKIKKTQSYILLYHAFTEELQDLTYNYCNINKFYNDIVKLKKIFEFSNSFEIKAKKPTVFITFDDGYRSIFSALDFLEANKIPSTIFLNGDLIKNNLLSKDKIRAVVEGLPIGAIIEFMGIKIKISKNKAVRSYLAMNLNNYLQKIMPAEEYRDYSEKFFKKYASLLKNKDLNRFKLISKKDIANIVKNYKFTRIEYHGYSHYSLLNSDESEILKEILAPNSFCNLIKSKPKIFSYPYGHFNKKISNILKNAGYRFALTTVCKNLNTSSRNIFELNRIALDQKN